MGFLMMATDKQDQEIYETHTHSCGDDQCGHDHGAPHTPYVRVEKIGRNDPCPCQSGKKYKKCCLKA